MKKNKLTIIMVTIICILTISILAGYFIPIKSSLTICSTEGKRFSIILGQSDDYDKTVKQSEKDSLSVGACESLQPKYYTLYLL